MAANYTIPLFYSAIFRVLAYNETQQPTLWVNGKDGTASLSPSSMTATSTVNVTCPPSGIPPLPTPVVDRRLDIWPPMAENLTFPVLTPDY
jgi:hypothetical protein